MINIKLIINELFAQNASIVKYSNVTLIKFFIKLIFYAIFPPQVKRFLNYFQRLKLRYGGERIAKKIVTCL